MKKIISTLTMASILLTISTAAYAAETRAEAKFDARAHSLNMSVEKNGTVADAYHAVSVETGVPQEKIDAMHKNHPKAGPAGILAACVLAAETKKDPDRFLTRFSNGRDWTSIAADNNVPIERLNARLERVETYVNSAPEKRKQQKHHKD